MNTDRTEHWLRNCAIISTRYLYIINLMQIGKIGQEKTSLPLVVFFYGAHTPAIDSRILSVQPRYTIINSLHGLWGQIPGNSVLQDTSIYKAAGIKVIGYLTSGYEGQGSAGKIDPEWYTSGMNQELIKNMADIDRVDGVFIDECSSFPNRNSRNYLKTLTDLAHSYNLITWGNVGEAQFDSWFFTKGGFDLMQSNENWHSQELSPIQRGWGYRISVTGSNPGYTAQDAYNITTNAWQKGLAYCYICSTGYTSLPSWFEDSVNLLREYVNYSGNGE